MAAIYVPVRIATLLVSGICFILAVIDLVNRLQTSTKITQSVIVLIVTVVILFVGTYGSYRHSRTYLLTFALMLFVAMVVGFFSPNAPYSTLGTCVVMIVLAVSQAELIRQGYH